MVDYLSACCTVDFRCIFRVACLGNLCFGKCNVLYCSVWGVQTNCMRNVEYSNVTQINCVGRFSSVYMYMLPMSQ